MAEFKEISLIDINVTCVFIVKYLLKSEENNSHYFHSRINACCLKSYVINEIIDYYNYISINEDFKKHKLLVSVYHLNTNSGKILVINFSVNTYSNIKFIISTSLTRESNNITNLNIYSKIINSIFNLAKKEIDFIEHIETNKKKKLNAKESFSYFTDIYIINEIKSKCLIKCLDCNRIITKNHKQHLEHFYNNSIQPGKYEEYSDDLLSNLKQSLNNIPNYFIINEKTKESNDDNYKSLLPNGELINLDDQ